MALTNTYEIVNTTHVLNELPVWGVHSTRNISFSWILLKTETSILCSVLLRIVKLLHALFFVRKQCGDCVMFIFILLFMMYVGKLFKLNSNPGLGSKRGLFCEFVSASLPSASHLVFAMSCLCLCLHDLYFREAVERKSWNLGCYGRSAVAITQCKHISRVRKCRRTYGHRCKLRLNFVILRLKLWRERLVFTIYVP